MALTHQQHDFYCRQLRAARAWLKWSRYDLSRACGLSHETIRNAENLRKTSDKTIKKINNSLALHGIVIQPDGGFAVVKVVKSV